MSLLTRAPWQDYGGLSVAVFVGSPVVLCLVGLRIWRWHVRLRHTVTTLNGLLPIMSERDYSVLGDRKGCCLSVSRAQL